MKLLAGLGNPGAGYALNRHNIGFMVADALHRVYAFAPWRVKFSAQIAEGVIGGTRVLLMKPQTYMNESGRAVGEAVRFHKIAAADVLIFHDELDLAVGAMRVRWGGGSAGHNGLKSLTAHITGAYGRVRMGIGHPGHKDLVAPYVLSDFTKSEEAAVEQMIDFTTQHVDLLLAGDGAAFQNRYALFLKDQKG